MCSRRCRLRGVERAVLCQHLGEYDNSYLESVVAEHPDLFRAVCLVDPAGPEWRRALRGVTVEGRFEGLRVVAATFHDNPALCAEALALRLTLVVWAEHGVADVVAAIRRLHTDHPDGRIVITHLGAPRVENDIVVAGWELLELAAQPGVFVTLSGQSMFCEYPTASSTSSSCGSSTHSAPTESCGARTTPCVEIPRPTDEISPCSRRAAGGSAPTRWGRSRARRRRGSGSTSGAAARPRAARASAPHPSRSDGPPLPRTPDRA